MSNKHIEVKQVAGYIGAEISGVDLSQPLHDEVVKEIRDALLKWKVIFFRNQNIDHAAQIAFTARFGEVTYAHPHEDDPIEGFQEIMPVDRSRYERKNGLRRTSYEHRWHTDVTAAINPPAASILRAVNVPSFGGDTTWTNLVAAYEGLSAPLRALADTLKAEHRFNARLDVPSKSKFAQRIAANPLVSIHPVVRVHPETGERALYVNPGFTSHILDVSRQESDLLLELFFNQITKPAYTTRFRWNNGDIAFWDNRATAHLAPQDLDHIEVERVLYRTTITGEVPVGVDGFRSQVVEGEVFSAEVPTVLKERGTLAPA
ncbi:MAG: TauD/TfdA family dioxygenase [Plectolyngbya sp. WJT66-NPBG17]|jgi:taurine dioxygenase|nr:TauD/TfdA family dioxygenase [Plectolyngbya sp. WJT66-NPBG17]